MNGAAASTNWASMPITRPAADRIAEIIMSLTFGQLVELAESMSDGIGTDDTHLVLASALHSWAVGVSEAAKATVGVQS